MSLQQTWYEKQIVLMSKVLLASSNWLTKELESLSLHIRLYRKEIILTKVFFVDFDQLNGKFASQLLCRTIH